MRIARHWRLNAQRYALEGVRCSACSANIFPPREVCPHCESILETCLEFQGAVEGGVLAIAVTTLGAGGGGNRGVEGSLTGGPERKLG